MMARHYAPHDYQKRAVGFVRETPKSALFLDMGLGKTSVVLTAVRDLIADSRVARVLVIAPKRVAERTWTDEAAKWLHSRGLRLVRVLGDVAQRKRAVETPGHVFIINRENVQWLCETFSHRWPFDTVVIDESSSFKDPSGKRFKALRREIRNAARVVLLTGTPAPNSYLELWSQFALIGLDRDDALGRNFTAYRSRFFVSDYMGWQWQLRDGAREEIEEIIRPYTLSLRAADYLTLPPRLDVTVPVALNPLAARKYRDFEREFVLDLMDDNEIISAANAAVLTGKLAQVANGAIYREDGSAEVIHDAKLDALAEILDTAQGPVLVAYTFRHDLARLRARFPDAVAIDDEGAIERWQAGEFEPGQALFAHPASAGHGLNLQCRHAAVVWFGLTWSLELFNQFNARVHRQGQETAVAVHYLVADGTIDEDIFEAITAKDRAQEALLNALRKRFESARQGGKVAA